MTLDAAPIAAATPSALLLPSGKIDLLVLSHSDSDHVGDTVDILRGNDVAMIVHPGDPRGGTLNAIRAAIRSEPGARVIDLSRDTFLVGETLALGTASVTLIAGWKDGHDTEGPGEPRLRDGPLNNALSIVVKFTYAGRSVLLTGDTVGRVDGTTNTACQYAERIMVERADRVPIQSQVLVGQHHGGDNATSNCFIRAVKPEWVVFSAGHANRHPRQSTADQLVAWGVDPDQILRTDRGDFEKTVKKGAVEWLYKTPRDCPPDPPSDDDVEIRLLSDPAVAISVAYRLPSEACKATPG